jgi:hypothetical protein
MDESLGKDKQRSKFSFFFEMPVFSANNRPTAKKTFYLKLLNKS